MFIPLRTSLRSIELAESDVEVTVKIWEDDR